MSACATGEELAQGGQVGLVGVGFNPVETLLSHADLEAFAAFSGELCIALSSPPVAGVDFDHLAGLGVFEYQTAERRQGVFVRVVDLDGHYIVPELGAVQGGMGEGIEEI